jgi:NADPH:quinone reductase-like Zn-dependent oxidoreductase
MERLLHIHGSGMMKVFAISESGQPAQIREVETPAPAAGEVRVRVRAASVNGFDLGVASGAVLEFMPHRFPLVVGKDFAGEVDALGAGVEGFEVGDRVFGVVTKDGLGDGSFGEYVTVPVTVGIAKLPETIEYTEAAALGLAGTAATDAFDAAEIGDGTVVVVAGATGGVGQQAVQLAVHAGAHVIATAHSEEEIALVKSLGAAEVVDYRGDVVEQIHASRPEGVDVVLHFAGAPDSLVPVVKQGGTFVSTMLRSAEDVPVEGITVVAIFANPSVATLDRIAARQAEKHTTVTVQQVYDLDDVPAAIEAFGAGTLGKLVIAIN